VGAVSRLLISFSGGRTSGYMTRRALMQMAPSYDEIVVLFANTGQEDSRTLDFVNACDRHFEFNTVWLEADVAHGERVGSRHRVVSYETASRDGRPFEDVIKKYGIPNNATLHCTRELKLNPMRSYVRSLGWEAGTYDQMVGIRADEFDRMSANAKAQRILYPLVTWGVTKGDVRDWWSKQPFDLKVPEHRGNCLWCYKKSRRKLLTLAKEDPTVFDFPARMEREYGMVGSLASKTGEPQKFFRHYESSADIIAASRGDFHPYVEHKPEYQFTLELDDQPNGCAESCEVDFV